MEDLHRLVSESLARYGVHTAIDPHRLQWSPWIRCTDGASLVRLSSKPGIFALSEQVAESPRSMLAVFRFSEAEDLGMALAGLLLPGSAERERLVQGRCFVRFAVVQDAGQRRSLLATLQQWMTSAAGAQFLAA